MQSLALSMCFVTLDVALRTGKPFCRGIWFMRCGQSAQFRHRPRLGSGVSSDPHSGGGVARIPQESSGARIRKAGAVTNNRPARIRNETAKRPSGSGRIARHGPVPNRETTATARRMVARGGSWGAKGAGVIPWGWTAEQTTQPRTSFTQVERFPWSVASPQRRGNCANRPEPNRNQTSDRACGRSTQQRQRHDRRREMQRTSGLVA